MERDLWPRIWAGETGGPLQEMVDAYRKKPDAPHITELGLAYLWLGHYNAAWSHFHEAADTYRTSMSVFFGMAGAAKWCLNQRPDAVKEWHRGLSCTYTDAARIRIPLLLYFASVVAPDLYPDAEARKLLVGRVENLWGRNWPGPVGEFVLGQIDEESLRAKCAGVNERDTLSRHWYIQFYMGVREYAKGHIGRFEELMRLSSSVSDDDFNTDHVSFRWKLGYEEFFLARHHSVSMATRG